MPAEFPDNYVIASHPIFTKSMHVFAHELLFRQCINDECAAFASHADATNKMIADGFSLATRRLGTNSLLSINVGNDNIMSQAVVALPADRVLLEIPGDIDADDGLLAACRDLRAAGYRFVIDNYAPDAPAAGSLAAIAAFLKIPVNEIDGKSLARIRKSLSRMDIKLIASRVETWDVFEGCRFLGFDYFQGFFFSYLKDIVGKKLSSHRLARFNIQRLLMEKNVDFSRVVDVISTDQALTVRLLHFVNSAAFSLGRRVDSLTRAAALIGLNALKKWAMTAILADTDASDVGRELSYRTLHSAVFLSLLGDRLAAKGPDTDTLYLLGLLHNVDAVMGQKMKDTSMRCPLWPWSKMRSCATRKSRLPSLPCCWTPLGATTGPRPSAI
ncbi:EAL and HDOD domain-containing protein [Solidesulfovibrio magneticus]|uniref:EAL and HDOD domain-containing protein n=1 Tax=Solidesulfovibrio magneticus TaxID=184917 RepID=UPI0013052DFC|nr:HDOD domain-containing protein [Solidesulfovibrio magneticus]